MFEAKKYPEKALKKVLYLLAIIVMSASIESFMLVKDLNLYQTWAREVGSKANFADYKAILTIKLLFNLSIPILYGIYAYIAEKKIGFSNLSRWLWTLLLFYVIAMKVIELGTSSIFWYFQLFALIYLLIINIRIPKYMKERETI